MSKNSANVFPCMVQEPEVLLKRRKWRNTLSREGINKSMEHSKPLCWIVSQYQWFPAGTSFLRTPTAGLSLMLESHLIKSQANLQKQGFRNGWSYGKSMSVYIKGSSSPRGGSVPEHQPQEMWTQDVHYSFIKYILKHLHTQCFGHVVT